MFYQCFMKRSQPRGQTYSFLRIHKDAFTNWARCFRVTGWTHNYNNEMMHSPVYGQNVMYPVIGTHYRMSNRKGSKDMFSGIRLVTWQAMMTDSNIRDRTTKSMITINEMVNDNASDFYRKQFEDNTINMASANDVAKAYNNFITQACQRVCYIRQINLKKTKYKAAGWFDTECRIARTEALRACETANQGHMSHIDAVKTCKNDRSAKQRKRRQFGRECLDELELAYRNDKNDIWDVINKFSTKTHNTTSPHPDVLLSHFTELSKATEVHYIDHSYDNLVKEYLQQYRSGDHRYVPQNELTLHIINMAFTKCEIERIIKRLKIINLQDVITSIRVYQRVQ